MTDPKIIPAEVPLPPCDGCGWSESIEPLDLNAAMKQAYSGWLSAAFKTDKKAYDLLKSLLAKE